MTYYSIQAKICERFIQVAQRKTQRECKEYIQSECLQGHFKLVKISPRVYGHDRVITTKNITR
jgi:hypothetical protein